MPLALFILCLISRISEGDTAGQCKPSERSISGKALTGHTYKAVTVSRPFECQVLCENDSKCRSYNFFLPEKICEMNSKTKEAEPQDFVKDDLRFHMKREGKINDFVNFGSDEALRTSCFIVQQNNR